MSLFSCYLTYRSTDEIITGGLICHVTHPTVNHSVHGVMNLGVELTSLVLTSIALNDYLRAVVCRLTRLIVTATHLYRQVSRHKA